MRDYSNLNYDDLDPQEKAFIDNYRQLDPEGKRDVFNMLRYLAQVNPVSEDPEDINQDD